MTDEIERIAMGLTEAQRDGLLHGRCGVPRSKEENASDCLCGHSSCEELQDLKLAMPRDHWPNGVIRTPLGQQVAAKLKEMGE